MKFFKDLFSFIFSLVFIKHFLIAITIVLSIILVFAISLRVITRHGEFIIVPNLVNSNYQESVELLTQKKLKIKIDSTYKPNIPPGTILEQNPGAQEKVKPEQTIYLTIASSDIPKVKLPAIEGLSLYEAKNSLKNENINVDAIEYSPDIQKDIVLKVKYNNEIIQSGESIPMFSSITLILGDGFGNNKIQVPDLCNLTLKEAIFALRGYGLQLGKVVNDNTNSNLDLESLKVHKQYPEPNNNIILNQGDKIDIYLQ